MAKPRLRLFDRAKDDLIEIRRYSIQQFGHDVANRYVDDIERQFRLLLGNPRMGATRIEFGANIRSILKKRHRILYRIEGNEVQVVRIMHHARQIKTDDLP